MARSRPRKDLSPHIDALVSIIRRAIVGARQPALRRIRRKLPEVMRREFQRCQLPIRVLGQGPSEGEILNFEAQERIKLPGAYRDFLLLLGDDVPGPDCGHARFSPRLRGPERGVELGLPSLLAPGGPPCAGEPEALLRGSLVIGLSDDASRRIVLIVTGEHRGRVVYLDLTSGAFFFPENRDFLCWYERWIDEHLAGCHVGNFGRTMPGFEPELVAALRGRRRIAAALEALCRLPSLETETIALIEPYLDATDDAIRSAAVRAHLTFDRPSSDLLRSRLNDPVVAIRRQIATHLATVRPANWEEELRPLIDDPDPTLASRVLGDLDKALSFDELVVLLADPRPLIRSRAAVLLATRDDPRLPAIARPFLRDALFGVVFAGLEVFSRFSCAEARADIEELVRGSFSCTVVRADIDPHPPGGLPDLRVSACHALARQDHDAGQAALLALCADEDPYIRADAARTIGKIGDHRALPTLRALLADITVPPSTKAMPPLLCMYPVRHFAQQAIDTLVARAR